MNISHKVCHTSRGRGLRKCDRLTVCDRGCKDCDDTPSVTVFSQFTYHVLFYILS